MANIWRRALVRMYCVYRMSTESKNCSHIIYECVSGCVPTIQSKFIRVDVLHEPARIKWIDYTKVTAFRIFRCECPRKHGSARTPHHTLAQLLEIRARARGVPYAATVYTLTGCVNWCAHRPNARFFFLYSLRHSDWRIVLQKIK